jgi:hypothetical protein
MTSPVPLSALFAFAIPIRPVGDIVIDGVLDDWSDEYALPSISLEGREQSATVYAAWSEQRLVFALNVPRTRAPRVLPKRLSDGDSFDLYIDTRDIRNAHRAGRYCHKFVIAPVGGAGQARSPLFEHQEIQRALMGPPHVSPPHVEIASSVRDDGYSIELALPASTLNGYDVDITRRMGLAYVLHDTERPNQIWPHTSELPVWNDTSLWATVELVD